MTAENSDASENGSQPKGRFGKGKSGNSNGRPKGLHSTDHQSGKSDKDRPANGMRTRR
jgi:hypothetical protein